MKKISKTLIAAALAGVMCLGAGALVACESTPVPGKSAYEIAVENGFSGTEQEWLDSLKTSVKDTDIKYEVDADGKTVAVVSITMTDNAVVEKRITLPRRVVSAEMFANVIWSATEAEQKSNLAGAVWKVVYDDGSTGALAASKSQIIDVTPYSYNDDDSEWDGQFTEGKVYKVTYCFGAHWDNRSTGNVYICNDVDTLAEYKNSSDPQLSVNINHVRKGEVIPAEIISIDQSYYLHEKLETTYNDPDNPYYGEEYFSRCTPVTETMLGGAIDTSKVGNKEISVTYNEEKISRSISVYDPSVSIVSNLYFTSSDVPRSIELTEGDDIATATALFANKKANVNFYEYVNGRQNEYITVTSEMIDASGVDTSKPGNYAIKISYKGYTEEIPVRVDPDMSTAQLSKTLTGAAGNILDLMFTHPVAKIELYSNNFAILYRDDDIPLTEYIGYLPYTLTGNKLEIKYGEEKVAIFKAEGETFSAYDFSAETLVKTYTGTMEMDGPPAAITLKTYANGYAEFTMTQNEQSMTIVIGYKLEGNTITMMPSLYGMTFAIGENDTITFNPNN